MNHTRVNKPMHGFTLIEIMVALVIGVVLMGGISQVYISLNQTNRISQSLSNLQETTRLNGDVLFEDLSHVGYLGCADPMETTPNVIYNGAPDHIKDFVENALTGWEVDATGWGDDVDLDKINTTGYKNAIIGSDVFRIKFLSRSNLTLASAMSNPNDNIALNSNIFGLAQDDVAAIGDCRTVDIFKVTGTTETPITIAHLASQNSSSALSKSYDDLENTTVRLLLSNTYFVADTGRNNSSGDPIHAIYRLDRNGDVEELAEGVENMQIMYGEEIITNACDPSTNQIRFVDADTANLQMENVSVIKIGLLMASNERILNSDDTTTYLLGNQMVARTGTPITYENDRRMRKAVNMTINIRNRRTIESCSY